MRVGFKQTLLNALGIGSPADVSPTPKSTMTPEDLTVAVAARSPRSGPDREVSSLTNDTADAIMQRSRPIVPPKSFAGVRAMSGTTREQENENERGLFDGYLSGGSMSGQNNVIQPPTPLTLWRDYGFDTNTIARANPAMLVQIISDLSPDVSRAIWDFLRFAVAGWEINVYKAGTETKFPRAEKAQREFERKIADEHGDLEIFFAELFMSAFLRGAMMTELVMDKDGRTPINLLVPDPQVARFRKLKEKDVLGNRWELGQVESNGDFTPLNTEKVVYLPVDKFPGNPYGRAPITPAIFSAIFLISMLNDIKRVIAQQGYPRLDIEINLEEIAALIPDDAASDPDTFNRWVTSITRDVQTVYEKLQPDDAFVHTSVVHVKTANGVLDVNSLGSAGAIINTLEGMAMKGLKSMPLLMGATAGMSEANANRQWEVYVEGIQSVQHRAENMLRRQFERALNAQGIQATVIVRFAKLRTTELLRDAMTKQLEVSNALNMWAYGAIDFPALVLAMTGKPDVPKDDDGKPLTEPRYLPKNFVSMTNMNAVLAEASSPGSAEPGMEGGDTEPVSTDKEDDRNADVVTRMSQAYLNREMDSILGINDPTETSQ